MSTALPQTSFRRDFAALVTGLALLCGAAVAVIGAGGLAAMFLIGP